MVGCNVEGGEDDMLKTKEELNFTDDPLTNIYKMVPLLDEDGRKAISCVMYGYDICKRNESKNLKQPKELKKINTNLTIPATNTGMTKTEKSTIPETKDDWR